MGNILLPEIRIGRKSKLIPTDWSSLEDLDLRGLLRLFEPPNPRARYSLGCLPDGEFVRTDYGSKRIENVGTGDKLLSSDGSHTPIIRKMRRVYTGELVGIRAHGATRVVWFTPEHPILSARAELGSRLHGARKDTELIFDWMNAADIEPNRCWVRFPIHIPVQLSPIEVMSYWPNLDIRRDFKCGPLPMLERDFWWLVGLWLADGHVTFRDNSAAVVCSLNTVKDEHNRQRVERVVLKLFGRSVCYRIRKGVTDCIFGSVEFAAFLSNHFGKYAQGKHIPHWAKSLPLEHCASIVEGYWEGDGCIEDNRILNFVSVSEDLMCDMQDLLLRLGIFGACRVLREEGEHHFSGRDVNSKTKRTFELNVTGDNAARLLGLWKMPLNFLDTFSSKNTNKYSFIRDGFLHLRVHRVERKQYNGYVNNFETTSHSYCSELLTVHNCDPTHGRTGWTRHARGEDDHKIDNGAIEVLRVGRGTPCKLCNLLTYTCTSESPNHYAPDIQVAEYAAPIDPYDLASVVNALGRLYCGRDEDGQCPAIIEVYPGPGGPTQRTLQEKYGYTNLYRYQYMDTGTTGSRNKFEYGWYSGKAQVQHLWTKGLRYLTRRGVILRSQELVEELADCQMDMIKMRGAAVYGAHDDRAVACLLAIWQAHNWTFDVIQDSTTKAELGPLVDWQNTDISSDRMHEQWEQRFDDLLAEAELEY